MSMLLRVLLSRWDFLLPAVVPAALGSRISIEPSESAYPTASQ
jgi:hypothetical protein